MLVVLYVLLLMMVKLPIQFLGYFGSGAPVGIATALGITGVSAYSPTNPPTVGGSIGPANGYEAICFVSGCPATTFSTPSPSPTNSPGAAAITKSGFVSITLLLSLVFVALLF